MKTQLTSILTAIAVFGVSASAQAGRHHDDRYDDDGVEYAEVLDSRPIYREVRVVEPREVCRDERVVYDDGYRGGGNEGVGALLGAVVGGVVGNRFGQGSGRAVATAAGAVVGASAGASIGRNNGGGRREPSYGYEQRCRTVDEAHFEQRVDGYDVRYRYHGRIYDTRLSYDPGDRLPVNVNVAPASY
ncbi:glycine zipper 2TM domain-containing protein [Nevskia sp.]|uniref:glycine zipper 2TM domain-containing protein n=1 Tax=Nevskia sp. TaxID=1929292 RepID=UPI0025F45631|nr:glycine zipper 2TM domain-containing protein [Nevskia sp.]HET7798062.1 glycine zipper 2TM domain-containing protein [Nevskia sp.]